MTAGEPGVVPIASLDDPRVADYRALTDPAALARAGLFVAEGRMVVRRLLALPRFRIRSVLVTPTALAAIADALAVDPRPPEHAIVRSSDRRLLPPVYLVSPPLMNAIVGFNIHRGCLALAERPEPPTGDEQATLLAGAARVVVLEGVNNPDNIGGIFRSAAAFGIDAVVIGPDCADPLYRKSIRTSMAATLQVPFVDADRWPSILPALRASGWRLIALTPTLSASPLESLPRDPSKAALLVGAEGPGLSPEALAAADDRVRIPMTGAVDSLNVAVASAIAMYYFRRRE